MAIDGCSPPTASQQKSDTLRQSIAPTLLTRPQHVHAGVSQSAVGAALPYLVAADLPHRRSAASFQESPRADPLSGEVRTQPLPHGQSPPLPPYRPTCDTGSRGAKLHHMRSRRQTPSSQTCRHRGYPQKARYPAVKTVRTCAHHHTIYAIYARASRLSAPETVKSAMSRRSRLKIEQDTTAHLRILAPEKRIPFSSCTAHCHSPGNSSV